MFPGVAGVNSVAVFLGSHIGAEPDIQSVFTSSGCETFFLRGFLGVATQHDKQVLTPTLELPPTGQACLIYGSLAGRNLTVHSGSKINADTYFCFSIPKLMRYFPQTEKGCVPVCLRCCFLCYFCFHMPTACSTVCVPSPEGCKLKKQKWLPCAGRWVAEADVPDGVT